MSGLERRGQYVTVTTMTLSWLWLLFGDESVVVGEAAYAAAEISFCVTTGFSAGGVH